MNVEDVPKTIFLEQQKEYVNALRCFMINQNEDTYKHCKNTYIHLANTYFALDDKDKDDLVNSNSISPSLKNLQAYARICKQSL